MEEETERTSTNAKQREEILDSASSNGQGKWDEQTYSTTTTASSTSESPEKQMESEKRALSGTYYVC